jgi:large subunit ribosomal protein L21
MYAIIRERNRQHRVTEGTQIVVDKMNADVGSRVEIADVLLAAEGDDVAVGTPKLANVHVTAEVVGHGRAPKVRIFHFRRRKDSRTLKGYRRPYTLLKIVAITKD